MDQQLLLPFDMIFEILSRTSLKTLDASRCISKDLHNLSYNSHFLNLHTKRNSIISGYLVQEIKHYVRVSRFAPSHGSPILNLDFLPRNARIIASSEQGIVVFESCQGKNYSNPLYHVCKPSTRQIVKIPNPKTRYITATAALVVISSNPLRYKIIRLSHPKIPFLKKEDVEYSPYRIEMFDSATWAWKELELLLLPYGVCPSKAQPVSARGSIYFLCTNDEVLRFDLDSEKWSTSLSLPTPTLNYFASKELVKYEGKPGFACRAPNGCWEVWVLDNKQNWERAHVFREEEDIRETELKALDDSDTILMEDHNELVFYKFKGGEKNHIINKLVLDRRPDDIFTFRSNLEPVNLKGR